MHPELFRIPFLDWPIRGYGLMIVLGFLLATWLATREARRRGLPSVVYDLGVVMLLSGLVGGRIFYFLQNYSTEFAGEPHRIFAIWEGGLVFYGGAIGGALGGFLFLKIKNLPIGELLDAIAAYVPIGMGFGRLGCFLNGCCWGGVCSPDFALGVSYPIAADGSVPGALHDHIQDGLLPARATESLPVYPVQLYETGVDLILVVLLAWYLRGPSPRAGGFPLLFVLYGIARFHLEFLRADNPPVLFFMTISQVVSAVLVAVFLPIFVFLWFREVRVPARVLPGEPVRVR